jgi:hypothetical protein
MDFAFPRRSGILAVKARAPLTIFPLPCYSVPSGDVDLSMECVLRQQKAPKKVRHRTGVTLRANIKELTRVPCELRLFGLTYLKSALNLG